MRSMRSYRSYQFRVRSGQLSREYHYQVTNTLSHFVQFPALPLGPKWSSRCLVLPLSLATTCRFILLLGEISRMERYPLLQHVAFSPIHFPELLSFS